MSLKIVNFSHTVLPNKCQILLSRGRTFTLPPIADYASLLFDVSSFARTLRFKHLYQNANSCNLELHNFIEYIKSKNDPPCSQNNKFETFLQSMEDSVLTALVKQHRENVFKVDKNLQFLKRFFKYKNLHLCYADKGGTLLVLNLDDYHAMVQTHLNDTTTYKKLSHKTDLNTNKKICDLITSNSTLFNKEELKYFLDFLPIQSKFYVLPKIHKSKMLNDLFKNTPLNYIELNGLPSDVTSRPIVSNINSPTSRVSHFLDKVLKPLLPLTTGYIKDTFDFLSRLPRTVSKDTTFVSLDVVNLYTIIPHDFGLEAIEYWLTTHSEIVRNIPTSLILDLLRIVLQHNTFSFKKELYLQLVGTAMGTKVAPCYAHLVMSYLEKDLFRRCQTLFGHEQTERIKSVYFRFLDDIFIVWDSQFGELDSFLDLVHALHYNFKFTVNKHVDKLSFLDVLVIRNGTQVDTDVFKKPTSSDQYLHFTSHHPSHTKRNIPYALASRLCRIVSNQNTLHLRLDELRIKLLNLQYPHLLIDDAINKSLRNIGNHQTKPALNEAIVPIVFTYSQDNTNFINNNVVRQLNTMNQSFNFFNNNQKIVKCYRQPTRLIPLLNCGDFHTFTCKRKLCKTCSILIVKKTFTFINNVRVIFNANMTCTTTDVVYVLFCSCNEFYVGETGNSLRQRITLHRQHVNHPEYSILKVSKHIQGCGGIFNVIPIFKIKNGTKLLRKKQEQFFIQLLRPGLNA